MDLGRIKTNRKFNPIDEIRAILNQIDDGEAADERYEVLILDIRDLIIGAF